MGHGANDKLFITPSEYSGVYGQHGATKGAQQEKQVTVPFHMCAITYQPWTQPACLVRDGLVCDKEALVAFVQQYGKSPATGEPATMEDILDLHISRNEREQWYDSISLRKFTDHSHMVAIRPSGHVYLFETVQQLNLKPKMMRDLTTDAAFTKSDIITLQDPHDLGRRTMQHMYHVQHHLTLAHKSSTEDVNAAATGSTRALLAQLRQNQQPKEQARGAPEEEEVRRTTGTSTGRTAASFTSSSLTPRTRTEEITVDEEAVMFEALSSRQTKHAVVRLQTNFGALVLELFVNKAPRTCYNFLALCERGTYHHTTFHRNVPGFMIQGGDPTGTGRGGESIWGHPFEDELCRPSAHRHTGRGILSMANKGVNTNGSQFFITYRATPHLDAKHTVFGILLGDDSFRVLDALERVPNVPDTTRPIRPIELIEAQVFQDPFATYMERRDAKARRENPDDEERARRELKRRKREDDRTTWLGTQLPAKDASSVEAPAPLAALADEHGLAGLRARKRSTDPPPRRARRGWGDLQGW